MSQKIVQRCTNIERRYIEFCNEGDAKEIKGYAATFDQYYEIGDGSSWGFQERIDRNAFTDADMEDVLALINHDDNDIPLARTTSKTLRLSIDEHGLFFALVPPSSPLGENARIAVERGDISKSSFAFVVAEDLWHFNEGGEPDRRDILKIHRVYDVSLVTHPANPNTDVALRSRDEIREKVAALIARRNRRLAILELERN